MVPLLAGDPPSWGADARYLGAKMRHASTDFPQRPFLRVATLVSHPLEVRVRSAVVPPGCLLTARDARDLQSRAARTWGDVAVLEPGVDPRAGSVVVGRWSAWVPLVLYVPLVVRELHDAIALARAVDASVVIAGYDDDPVQLRADLEAVRGSPFGRALAARLEERLRPLPARMRSAVAALCVSATSQDTAARLAAVAGVDPSTLARHFAQAGLCRPHHLLIAARIARAFPALVDPHVSAAQVARAVGLTSAAALDRQLRTLVGQSVRELRSQPADADQFIERLVGSVCPARSEQSHAPRH